MVLVQVVIVMVLSVYSTAAPVHMKHLNLTYGVDLCTVPSPDPCSPGGKWDPLLTKLVDYVGYSNVSLTAVHIKSLEWSIFRYAPINIMPHPSDVMHLSM